MKGFLARVCAPILGLGRALVSYGLGSMPASPVLAQGMQTIIVATFGNATTIVITEPRGSTDPGQLIVLPQTQALEQQYNQ